jgi:hypothetical protein
MFKKIYKQLKCFEMLEIHYLLYFWYKNFRELYLKRVFGRNEEYLLQLQKRTNILLYNILIKLNYKKNCLKEWHIKKFNNLIFNQLFNISQKFFYFILIRIICLINYEN